MSKIEDKIQENIENFCGQILNRLDDGDAYVCEWPELTVTIFREKDLTYTIKVNDVDVAFLTDDALISVVLAVISLYETNNAARRAAAN